MDMFLVLLFERSEFRTLYLWFYLFQSKINIARRFLWFVSLPLKKWTPTSYEENLLIIPIFSRILASFCGSHKAIGKDKNMATSLVLLFEPCEFRTLLTYFIFDKVKSAWAGGFFCFVFFTTKENELLYIFFSLKFICNGFLWFVSLPPKKWAPTFLYLLFFHEQEK